MGLDMYAYTTKTPIGGADFDVPGDAMEIAYWRKHPNLHGWFEQVYREIGGERADFNVTTLRIDAAHIDALEHALDVGGLPHTAGFFFGESRPEEIDLDRVFIAKAREAFAAGMQVFYYAWW